jgi:F-type H+-transporting ATPase subunit a
MWGIHQETVFATWVLLLVIIITIIAARFILYKKNEIASHIITSSVKYFVDLCTETMGFFDVVHFSFVTSLFIFIFLCNTATVFFPWLEEPTSDLNTAFALGITSFIYIQVSSIQAIGFRAYMKEYLTPPFMFPLHLTGKIASIVSISFRLFGNIFGGGIITQIYNSVKMGSLLIESALLLTGMNLIITLFFGLFEGLIQAFVFSMLTLTYLAIGMQKEEEGVS